MNETKKHKFLISNDFKNSKKIKSFVLDKTYVENLTTYKQSLLILKQIDNMLKELSGPKSKKKKKK